MNTTKAQDNVLHALRRMIRRDRPWLSLDTLQAYDGRTIAALLRRGLIEIDFDYGVRVAKEG